MKEKYLIKDKNILKDNKYISDSDADSEVFKKIDIDGEIPLNIYTNLDDFEVKKIKIIEENDIKKNKIINYKKILIEIIKKFNLEESQLNSLKGKIYEFIVLKHLKEINNYRCWLWKNVPLFYLLKSNIIIKEQFYYYLSRKNKYRNNPILDIGIDILVKENDNYIFIQCKNHKNSISYHDLAGYFMMLSIHSNIKGIVYHTSKINRTLKEFADRSNRCTYIRLPI